MYITHTHHNNNLLALLDHLGYIHLLKLTKTLISASALNYIKVTEIYMIFLSAMATGDMTTVLQQCVGGEEITDAAYRVVCLSKAPKTWSCLQM